MTDAQYNGIVNFDQRADVIDAWRQLVALAKGRAAGSAGERRPDQRRLASLRQRSLRVSELEMLRIKHTIPLE
jgi:hypothetical protein